MPVIYLHDHPEFQDLINIVADHEKIIPLLVEKDYWIMHVLYGLTTQGFRFELKGGTSLSKGYKIINRFSEDIDIYIKPSAEMKVSENPNQRKASHIASRSNYYDWLTSEIKIDGISAVVRDKAFDDAEGYFRSGGIRLFYKNYHPTAGGLKEGILLEAGFDQVTPNHAITISSWINEYVAANPNPVIEIIDNRAVNIACYDPGYTLVEKLQTISTKFRVEMEKGTDLPNLMRQYYDVYSLLDDGHVQAFIGSDEYKVHKDKRFSGKDKEVPIGKNEAFLLSDPDKRKRFKERYAATAGLYYRDQPDLELIMERIGQFIDLL